MAAGSERVLNSEKRALRKQQIHVYSYCIYGSELHSLKCRGRKVAKIH